MSRSAKLIPAAIFLVLFLGLAFQVAVVPTPSMESTVLVGDHLLIDRLSYGPPIPFTDLRLPRIKKVRRGEVVSFHPPGRPADVYLKRVVAVAGDRVETCGSAVYVNEAVADRACGSGRRTLVLAEGELYMLGDNRDRSEDSRYFGPVPEANVIGEPVIVLWSFAHPTDRWLKSRVAVYFDHPVRRMRWARLFQRVR